MKDLKLLVSILFSSVIILCIIQVITLSVFANKINELEKHQQELESTISDYSEETENLLRKYEQVYRGILNGIKEEW